MLKAFVLMRKAAERANEGKVGAKKGLKDAAAAFKEAFKEYTSTIVEVNDEAIKKDEKKFRYSKEEEEELISFYLHQKGDITLILESIVHSRNEDIDRYIAFYERNIRDKVIPKMKLFAATKG
jgi:hypothetical protein